ncbi:MAG: HAD family hydrolase [Phycisphaerales bacterium]
MLMLFDVDGTLVTTSGVGIEAMRLAGRELFGDHFDAHAVEYAGRLDPLIITDLLRTHELPHGPDEIDVFRGAYRTHLTTLLDGRKCGRPCPGVPELLNALDAISDVTLGLLTGNYPDTGAIKLRACGIDPDRFTIAVWGMDSPHDPPDRTHLPPIGIARYEAIHGQPPRGAVIIGDTPHDIRCAAANDCRSLGVATGKYSVAELNESGADLALEDLSDTDAVLKWMLNAAEAE